MIRPANNPSPCQLPPPPPERAGLIRIPFADLTELLKLPVGITIDAVVIDPQHNGVTVRVRGHGLPDHCIATPNSVLPFLEPAYRVSVERRIEFIGFDQHQR